MVLRHSRRLYAYRHCSLAYEEFQYKKPLVQLDEFTNNTKNHTCNQSYMRWNMM